MVQGLEWPEYVGLPWGSLGGIAIRRCGAVGGRLQESKCKAVRSAFKKPVHSA